MLLAYAFETLELHRGGVPHPPPEHAEPARAIERLGAAARRHPARAPDQPQRQPARHRRVAGIIAAEWPLVRTHLDWQLRRSDRQRLPIAPPPFDHWPWQRNLTSSCSGKLERAGAPACRPRRRAGGVQRVTGYSMEDNSRPQRLWLLSTLGGKARAADAMSATRTPAAGARGRPDRLRRQAQATGRQDDEASCTGDRPDGGVLRGASGRGHRRRRPLPGARRPPPGLRLLGLARVEGHAAHDQGEGLQGTAKETGYVTSEARSTATGTATCRWAGCRTCWSEWAPTTGRVRDLFREATTSSWCAATGPPCLRHRRLARRAPHRLRVRPATDKARQNLLRAGRDRPQRTGGCASSCATPAWTCRRPLQPGRRRRIAFWPATRAASTPCRRPAGGVGPRWRPAAGRCAAANGTMRCAPLLWEGRPVAALHRRAEPAASTCGAST